MVTYDCNWDCPFCITDTHTKSRVTLENLISKISAVEDRSIVSISGGEPGTLSENTLRYIISTLRDKNCSININTNGLFFKKYPEYVSQIDGFFYHCTENLDPDKGIVLYDSIDYNKTEFMMVLTDNNYHNLEWFINNYDILFTLVAADRTTVKGQPGDSLSVINGMKICSKYKDRINRTSYLNLMERGMIVSDNLNRI